LKLEKVYLPCILVTMKRYVGWSYESIHSPPSFDAKGIEIVRRDTCAVVAKMQEQMLRILFETRDLSKVKAYLMKQWTKLWKGGAYLNIQDFVFAKEVRLGSYRGIGPPGAIVAQKMLDLDPNAETPHYWRVPYIVVYGNAGGGNRLIDLVVSPEALLIRGNGLVLNIKYYIDKCINPALQRILILCGVNHAISTWYAQVNRSNPRLRKVVYAVENMKKPVLTTIDSFFLNKACEFCGKHSKSAICPECLQDKPRAYASVISQLNCKATVQSTMQSICQNCTQHSQALSFLHSGELLGPDCCSSISCSFFQKRYRLMLELEDLNYVLTNVKW
jgi:DNA polymerase zeta